MARTMEHSLIVAVWCISIAPIIAQMALLAHFGGVEPYLSAVSVRHMAFRGLGPLAEVAKSIGVINIFYYAAVVINARRRMVVFFFLVHLVLSSTIILLSGSRTSLLMNLLMLAIITHYARKRISYGVAAVIACVFLLAATVIAVVRLQQSTFTLEEGLQEIVESRLTETERQSTTLHFKYALIPMEVVLSDGGAHELKYGSTYLTIFTNIIPRDLWPEKPDPASRIMTTEYLGNMWNGNSEVNAGFLGEAMINFGILPGIVTGVSGLGLILMWIEKKYSAVRRDLTGPKSDTRRLIVYTYIVTTGVSLVYSEPTVVVTPLLLALGSLSALWLLRMAIIGRRKIRATNLSF